MNDYKGIAIKFLVLFLLCIKCNILFVSGEIRCIAREREALLRIKQGLIDDYGRLASWGSEDNKKECCEWEGVRCSNITGHVISLRLGGQLRGKISSALLELHRLNHLDLSWNDFGGIRIPEFIGSIENLQFLDLYNSNFTGIIPPQLGNLTNLQSLDLSLNYIWSDSLYWLPHLSLLSKLRLGYANISDTNWLQNVQRLRSLQILDLYNCGLTDATFSAGLFVNSSSTSLSSISLPFNQFTSSIFDWLSNTSTSLVMIDLSGNQLGGPIPDAFGKLIFLEFLDLSENMLEGGIPKSLGNLSHLQDLDLSRNDLGEPLEELLGNLSCKVMVYLMLSNNQLTGSVLDLRKCLELRELYLDYNKLTMLKPASLSHLSKLEIFDVSHNFLKGTISEAYFMDLHNLKLLGLSFNRLTLDFSPDWIPSVHLYHIDLASCKMGASFPIWLQTPTNFSYLDISFAGISGEVPQWLWNMSSLRYLNLSHNQISGTIPDLSTSSIDMLDVGSNKFSGPVPFINPEIWVLQLSQNMFSGPILSICPYAYCRIEWLDASNNQLVGELPKDWENMKALEILNVNYNNLSGEIPHSLGSLQNLKTLHLRGNNFYGELPSTLKNCRLLQQIDIGGNKLTGNIPPWLGENCSNLVFLSLHRNRFYGVIPPEICKLTQIQLLDLSANNITGEIPKCFNNFTALIDKNKTTTTRIYIPIVATDGYIDYTLVQWKGEESVYTKTLGLLKLIDLSSNRLVGSIPESVSSLVGLISLNLSRNSLTGNINRGIGDMEMLEVLDLSRNQLSGKIPSGLAQLHFLAVLNLANNNLTGKIPPSPKLQGFDPSFYAGNGGLCGLPLSLCPEDGLDPSPTNKAENTKEKNDGSLSLSFMQQFGISMAFGFIFGFWGVVGPLLLKKSWREAYFNFLDGVGDWLYVTIAVFLRKFRRS